MREEDRGDAGPSESCLPGFIIRRGLHYPNPIPSLYILVRNRGTEKLRDSVKVTQPVQWQPQDMRTSPLFLYPGLTFVLFVITLVRFFSYLVL